MRPAVCRRVLLHSALFLSAAACSDARTPSAPEATLRPTESDVYGPPSIVVSPSAAVIRVGQVLRLDATAANVRAGRNVRWTSSAPELASVNQRGVVRGIAIGGPVLVIARVGDVADTATIRVAPTGIIAVSSNDEWNGRGRVTSDPAGIDCRVVLGVPSGKCSAPFAVGSTISVTATARNGSVLRSFGCSTMRTTATCAMVVWGDQSVHPAFMNEWQRLTVRATAGGAYGDGMVTSNVEGIDCTFTGATSSGTCSVRIRFGTVLTLLATPAAGSRFESWSGDGHLPGSDIPERFHVMVRGPTTAWADFDPLP